MIDELIKYLEEIVDVKCSKFANYDVIEFIATFNNIDKNVKLYVGNNSFKFEICLECPICNLEVFSSMNIFNKNCISFNAYHDSLNVMIECVSYYNDLVMNVKEVLDELMTDDYEYVCSLIDVIDKNNRIDKVELFENVISILSEDNKNE